MGVLDDTDAGISPNDGDEARDKASIRDHEGPEYCLCGIHDESRGEF